MCIVKSVKTQLTKTDKMMAFTVVEDGFGTIEAVVFPNIYEKCAMLLNDSNALIIRGHLNFKENEEPKIICDSLEKARTNEECKNYRGNRSATPNYTADNLNTSSSCARPNIPKALYLRIDDLNTELYYKAKRILDIFEGNTPVIFYLTNTNRKVKAPANMWVSLNEVMVKELKFQLGNSNVVAK